MPMRRFETNLAGFEDGGFDGTGITGDTEDDFIGVAGADARGHVAGDVDGGSFIAVSAMTRPIAAGDPAMKPKACPGTAWKAFCRAAPALAENVNSRCPESLMYSSPAFFS